MSNLVGQKPRVLGQNSRYLPATIFESFRQNSRYLPAKIFIFL